MIRIVAIATMLTFLCVLFYLPSVFSGEHFLLQIRKEHERISEYWGEDLAFGAMSMALAVAMSGNEVQSAPPVAESPERIDNPAAKRLDEATKATVERMRSGLSLNNYTTSIGALVTLLIYRASCFLLALPLALAFVFACLADGWVTRWVRSREFRSPNPEVCAISSALSAFVFCGTSIVCLLPVPLHPFILIVPPMLVGLFAGTSIANYHARI